jgi:hypothetical protein
MTQRNMSKVSKVSNNLLSCKVFAVATSGEGRSARYVMREGGGVYQW